MSIPIRILLSRFLTRFGDQAWDFAIPLVLISIFPGQLQNVAGYYLISKLAQFFLNPIVTRWIDHLPRKMIYKLGIGSQTLAVIFTWALITKFQVFLKLEHDVSFWIIFLLLCLSGIVGSLGSTLMEISIGFDLAVDQIPAEDLSLFNSRLKRIDLLTEVTAPIFAGAVMLLPNSGLLNVGFTIVAFLNMITFVPEYLLLSTIHSLDKISVWGDKLPNLNPIQEFKSGISEFKDPRYVIPMLAYALLWISVLSPHGVLLAGFLKHKGQLSEFYIAIFRGLGAFFGIIPTFLFPLLKNRFGLIRTSKVFLFFQTITVIAGAIAFEMGFSGSMILFLALILLSRVGLYGFSIGESEARQIFIPSHLRGRINGVGVSLTSFATLTIFGAGTLLPQADDFRALVWLSTISVTMGFLLILKWNPKK